jgi:AcrR family transcriptional regulator
MRTLETAKPANTSRPKQTDTRDKLVAVGGDLFYQHGFHATGIDRVCREAGVTRQTFYNHFESRDDLALEVIKTRDGVWRKKFATMLRERAGPDPADQLREVFHLWRDWFDNVHFKGCIFLHAASEFPDPHDPCHQAAKNNVDALRLVVERLAREAGIDDANDFALQFSVIMQGAIMVEVIDRQNTAAAAAGRVAEALLEQHLPAAAV